MRCLVLLLAMTTSASATPRTDFAAKLATVKPGMTGDAVKKLLGAPDDIKTEKDPGGITASRTDEVWRYGTSAHLKLGTLGTVHLMKDKTVQYVIGARGTPFTGLPEPELRKLLELINAVPSYNEPLDSLALVRAVNALQPLGKDTALDVVDEYLRVSSPYDDNGREGVFLLLRTLFDVPPKGMPPMMVGSPDPSAPNNPKLLPRFPIMIVEDVPLKVVSGYDLGGKAEPPEDDVKAFRKVGKIRAKPLAPKPTALEQIDITATKLEAHEIEKAMLFDQALQFFGTAYQPADLNVDTWLTNMKQWKVHRAAIAKLGIKWNATTQQMELPSGKPLTVPVFGNFQRVWWDMPLQGAANARVTFQRLSDDDVRVEIRFDAAGKLAEVELRFHDPGNTATDVGATMKSSVSQTLRLQLPRGATVQPELATGARGPVLTP